MLHKNIIKQFLGVDNIFNVPFLLCSNKRSVCTSVYSCTRVMWKTNKQASFLFERRIEFFLIMCCHWVTHIGLDQLCTTATATAGGAVILTSSSLLGDWSLQVCVAVGSFFLLFFCFWVPIAPGAVKNSFFEQKFLCV